MCVIYAVYLMMNMCYICSISNDDYALYVRGLKTMRSVRGLSTEDYAARERLYIPVVNDGSHGPQERSHPVDPVMAPHVGQDIACHHRGPQTSGGVQGPPGHTDTARTHGA